MCSSQSRVYILYIDLIRIFFSKSVLTVVYFKSVVRSCCIFFFYHKMFLFYFKTHLHIQNGFIHNNKKIKVTIQVVRLFSEVDLLAAQLDPASSCDRSIHLFLEGLFSHLFTSSCKNAQF